MSVSCIGRCLESEARKYSSSGGVSERSTAASLTYPSCLSLEGAEVPVAR